MTLSQAQISPSFLTSRLASFKELVAYFQSEHGISIDRPTLRQEPPAFTQLLSTARNLKADETIHLFSDPKSNYSGVLVIDSGINPNVRALLIFSGSGSA